jgi:mannose-6-phosphate isomerase-like protein (cupin superfamily)
VVKKILITKATYKERDCMAGRSLMRACVFLGLLVPSLTASASDAKILNSDVVPLKKARKDGSDWGRIAVYFERDTLGARASFAVTVELKPDSEVNPPHEHVEEECLLVTKGAGTCVLSDKSFPAKAGDMPYTAPNVLHGIRSAKDSGLTFVEVKFAPRIPLPEPDTP